MKQTLFSMLISVFVSVLLLAEVIGGIPASFADQGYSIRCVDATPKRGTYLRVGEHVMLSVTLAYKLSVREKGFVGLVLEKDDNSPLTPGHKQVIKEVSRGSGEITLTDEFDVPSGTSLVRLFVPIRPDGYTRTSGEVVIEYPIR
jgi:hypothetical protein